MNRSLALIGLLATVGFALLLASPAVSAITYPQAGYDAGRTGAVPFELPRANDTAFELELPGTPTGTIAIDGSTAYVVTLDHDLGENDTLSENALWSIDLDTAKVTQRFQIFDERPDWSTAFTDGERVYTQVERTVTAYDLDGEELWTWDVPSQLPEAQHVTCFDDPAFLDGSMYLACLEVRERRVQTEAGSQETDEIPQTGAVLGVLDAETGEERWRWFGSLDDNPGGTIANGAEETTPSELWDVLNLEVTATENRVFLYGIVFGRDRASTTTDPPLVADVGPEQFNRWFQVWGLDTDEGRFEVFKQGEPVTYNRRNYGVGTDGLYHRERALDGKIAATPATAIIEWGIGDIGPAGTLEAFNPTGGSNQWEHELSAANSISRTGSHAIGIREETVLAASPRAIARLDIGGEFVWENTVDPARPVTYGTSPLIVGEDTAIVEMLPHETDGNTPVLNRSGYGLQALGVDSGDVVWEHWFDASIGPPSDRFRSFPSFERQWFHSSTPGFGEGLVVAAAPDGHVEVLGETAVSMGGPDVDTERFPPVGENVTLDLSDTEPGAFGPATRYRVEWGDGTATPWQEDPVFTHSYEEEGEHIARLMAGNDANQTASTFVTMRVGETEPNFVETAFQRENQDMTFGVIGVALALGGGIVGVGRRYRKRSRLQKELETLEEGFEETKDRPSECEAFLDTSKRRARSLALDGDLRGDQVPVIENRVEELRGQLRTEALEDEFGFLPYSLVTRAREMVEDGKISSLEREAFLRALEKDEVLTSDQKALVRERIGSWYGRDEGHA